MTDWKMSSGWSQEEIELIEEVERMYLEIYEGEIHPISAGAFRVVSALRNRFHLLSTPAKRDAREKLIADLKDEVESERENHKMRLKELNEGTAEHLHILHKEIKRQEKRAIIAEAEVERLKGDRPGRCNCGYC